MDDFEIETTLSGVIDQFVMLQKWAAKADASRNLDQVFSVILRVREKLKLLEKMDRSHPLQGLAREIRAEFDTREFRAVLLAPFNWRSAKKKLKQVGAAAVKEQSATARSKIREIPNRAVKSASVLAVASARLSTLKNGFLNNAAEALTQPAARRTSLCQRFGITFHFADASETTRPSFGAFLQVRACNRTPSTPTVRCRSNHGSSDVRAYL